MYTVRDRGLWFRNNANMGYRTLNPKLFHKEQLPVSRKTDDDSDVSNNSTNGENSTRLKRIGSADFSTSELDDMQVSHQSLKKIIAIA